MKTIHQLIILALTMLLAISSCTKDELNEKQILANKQNAEENETIALSVLNTGIEIENATRKTGLPPSPNSDISFQLDNGSAEAIQNTGFTLRFSTKDSYKGAYIVLKDKKGNTLDNYFDVQDIENSHRVVFRKGEIGKSSFIRRETSNDDEPIFNNRIEILFNEEIPAGQFCYDICLYDDENNVSEVQTVCVTVQAWGGNAAIFGEWTFDRVESNQPEDFYVFNCSNANRSLQGEYAKILSQELSLQFDEDGSFTLLDYSEINYLDIANSEEKCEVIYKETTVDNSKVTGNWAYDEDKKILILVQFGYQNLINLEDNFISTEGSIISDDFVVSFEKETMVWTITNEFNNLGQQTIEEEIIKYYFNKKK